MTDQKLTDLIDVHRAYRTQSGWFSCCACSESWRDHDGFAEHLAVLIEAEFMPESGRRVVETREELAQLPEDTAVLDANDVVWIRTWIFGWAAQTGDPETREPIALPVEVLGSAKSGRCGDGPRT